MCYGQSGDLSDKYETTDEGMYNTVASLGIETSKRMRARGRERGHKLLTIYDRLNFEMPKKIDKI